MLTSDQCIDEGTANNILIGLINKHEIK